MTARVVKIDPFTDRADSAAHPGKFRDNEIPDNNKLARRMRTSVYNIVAAVLLAATISEAALTEDETLIRTASEVTLLGKGLGRVQPATEQAFWRLYEVTNAIARLKVLVRESTPAGQAYCLFGLYYLDTEGYKTAKRLNTETNEFDLFLGDYGTRYDLAFFIKLLDRHTFDGVNQRRNEIMGQQSAAPLPSAPPRPSEGAR